MLYHFHLIQKLEEIENILTERKKNWKQPEPKYKKGPLAIYTKFAVSPMKGGIQKLNNKKKYQ